MIINKRHLMVVLAVCGLAIGVAFGVGIAYGRGDPKTVETGLTQQQVAALLGGSGNSNPPGAATRGNQAGGLLGNTTIGAVTATEGQTVTVKTAQADVKVQLDATTKINKYGGSAPELQVGDSVVVAGTRQADGTILATSVSQMPSELQALAEGFQAPSGVRPGATP